MKWPLTALRRAPSHLPGFQSPAEEVPPERKVEGLRIFPGGRLCVPALRDEVAELLHQLELRRGVAASSAALAAEQPIQQRRPVGRLRPHGHPGGPPALPEVALVGDEEHRAAAAQDLVLQSAPVAALDLRVRDAAAATACVPVAQGGRPGGGAELEEPDHEVVVGLHVGHVVDEEHGVQAVVEDRPRAGVHGRAAHLPELHLHVHRPQLHLH
mmetsp:Transcript_1824/g.5785  ORF Transcript_1824/g.5785 Transcript_1824/m.5785 type:complete len:213 (-) Transcript_1824:237-875(-)